MLLEESRTTIWTLSCTKTLPQEQIEIGCPWIQGQPIFFALKASI